MVREDDEYGEASQPITRVCLGPIQGSTLACNELLEIMLDLIEESKCMKTLALGIVDNGFGLWLDPGQFERLLRISDQVTSFSLMNSKDLLEQPQ